MEIGSLFEKVKSDKFYKVSASGNDFIVFLDLDSKITLEEGAILARQLCRAKFSISADGFIIITRPSQTQAKFAWNFYNSDGSIAEMCGNGARAVARLLAELGMISEPFFLETLAGLIYAEVKGKRVKVSLGKPKDTKLSFTLRTEYDWYLAHYVNTGVPHVVLFWENVDSAPVEKVGPKIRFHEEFQPAGTNVNFVELISIKGGALLKIRTYERGVEGETFACGTGASAAAYIAYKLGLVLPPVNLVTKGGEILTVYISSEDETIYLEGDTRFLCEFKVFEDALI